LLTFLFNSAHRSFLRDDRMLADAAVPCLQRFLSPLVGMRKLGFKTEFVNPLAAPNK